MFDLTTNVNKSLYGDYMVTNPIIKFHQFYFIIESKFNEFGGSDPGIYGVIL